MVQPTEIPQKILAKYMPVNLCWQTEYFKVYEARSRDNVAQEFFIRILKANPEHCSRNYDLAATLFIQELLYLSPRLFGEEALIIQDFQIENNVIGCVMKPYQQLRELKEENKADIDLEKLVKAITADLDFLSDKMMAYMNSIVDDEHIFKFKDSNTFFLSNLDALIATDTYINLIRRMDETQVYEREQLWREKQKLTGIALELRGKSNASIENEFSTEDSMDSLNLIKGECLHELNIKNPNASIGNEKCLHLLNSHSTACKSRKIVWCSYGTNQIDVYDILSGKKNTDQLYGVGMEAGSILVIYLIISLPSKVIEHI